MECVIQELKTILFVKLQEYMTNQEARKEIQSEEVKSKVQDLAKYMKIELEKEVKLSRELDRKLWMEVVIENAKINNHPEVVANNVLKHFKDKF